MKFRLKFWVFELDIETPEPAQVSTIDVVSAVFSAIANQPVVHQIELVTEDDPED
jgi:hypothetical protein